MQRGAAKKLLGFSPNSHPTLSQIKAAYKRKVLQSHPDLLPAHEKSQADSKFKQVSEACSCLKEGTRFGSPTEGTYVGVVTTGVPMGYGRSNRTWVKTPFVLLVLGIIFLWWLECYKGRAGHTRGKRRLAYPSPTTHFYPLLESSK